MNNPSWLPDNIVKEAKISMTLAELQGLLEKYSGISISLGLDPCAEFGDRLRALRIDAGITTKELGDRIGAASSTLRHWEHGSGNPSFRYIELIASAFGIAPSHLFPQVPQQDNKLDNTLPEALIAGEVSSQITGDSDGDLDFKITDGNPSFLDED